MFLPVCCCLLFFSQARMQIMRARHFQNAEKRPFHLSSSLESKERCD